MDNKPKVLVAMSGGVDSTVAALLLQQTGYDPVGLTMIMWSGAEENPFRIEAEKAAESCERMSIPHHTLDLQDTFETEIVRNFAESYLNGETPNPCVVCNRAIKWQYLLQFATKMGIEKVATGHYSRIMFDEKLDRYALYKAYDERKDQTYMLWRLSQEALSRTLFPLSETDKPEVKKLANQYQLTPNSAIDSQDICFLPDNDYRSFLLDYYKDAVAKIGDGDIVNEAGEVLGKHHGFFNYTIGQRKGLGIAMGTPIYVKAIDAKKNQVVISDPDSLSSRGLIMENVNWVSEPKQDEITGTVQIRYNHRGVGCRAIKEDDKIKIIFDESQRAVTPGQSAVIYKDGKLIVGGFITHGF